MKQKITVIGAGSFGIALSTAVAQNAKQVCLWTRGKQELEHFKKHRCHPHFLKGICLSKNASVTGDMASALEGAEVVIFAIPMVALRSVAKKAVKYLAKGSLIISTTKGIEQETLKLTTEVLKEELTVVPEKNITFLTGPSFALEVAQGKPTALIVGATEPAVGKEAISVFHGSKFQFETSQDLIGLQVCSALKNVVAIAAGVFDGLKLGHNAMASLMTKGLNEIGMFIEYLGGNPRTIDSVAGVGDLILTCYGELSRNRQFGQCLSQGLSPKQAIEKLKTEPEGVNTIDAAWSIAQKNSINSVILKEIRKIISGEEEAFKAACKMLK